MRPLAHIWQPRIRSNRIIVPNHTAIDPETTEAIGKESEHRPESPLPKGAVVNRFAGQK